MSNKIEQMSESTASPSCICEFIMALDIPEKFPSLIWSSLPASVTKELLVL